jgi:hypothetical protein
MSEAKQPTEPTPWLAELEQRVRQAVTEIGRLRQDNRRLERELAKLRKGGGTADGGASWERERADLRGRVERLSLHLEELLGEPAEGTLPLDLAGPAGS